MPASDKHPDYEKSLPKWEKTRDCVKGAMAVKRGRTKYLPKPNPSDTTDENSERYDQYLERANFVGFTNSTLEGMLGMVFRKPIQSELAQAVEYAIDDITGSGISLDQAARWMVSDILQTGRIGLLVDYPPAPEGLTAAEVAELNLRANVLPYKAESIINWRTKMVGGIRCIVLVVLAEDHEILSEDGFSSSVRTYHRVLQLVDGIYVQSLYNDKDELVDTYNPKKSDGSAWKEIPFVFCGAQNNDATVDGAPLYDIAEINIAHYRNSADFEESSFMVGQPTLSIMGLTQSWVDEVMKGGVMLGSRRAILGPEGASTSLLQANANQMPQLGMEQKEAQMVKLGARIIQDSTGTETAEAAKIRFAGQNSKLGVVVGNIESALLKCLSWMMEFMGGDGENFIEVNKKFYDATVDPQLIIARIQLLDRGVIAKSDLQDKLRIEGEIAQDRTNEMIDEEAESQEIL